ncbi:MAG TPA: GntR family transcriptional regulator [Roseiflexaceae bacterium]|nr:GntR family transcriptional regulator [Roseiflexaceae bacterium]HMP39400.1 GntR family transcriptional regulator [Roseiflexaceae bacterium]
MTRGYVTADDIRHAIISRISSGVYPPGASLPSHRRLADELGANRNTIQKACRSLVDLGILEAVPGRRTPVVRRVPEATGVLELLRERTHIAVWDAMAAGVAREQLLEEFYTVVEAVYAQAEVRIRFFECNQYDSDMLAEQLARLLELPVAAGLLDELADNAATIAHHHDLIVTTFHHLAEVGQALPHHRTQVIGVDTRPSPATILGLARLTHPRIGLICTLNETAQTLRHVILSYQPDRSVATALIDAPDDVRRLAAECDHLVVTHNCVADLAALVDRTADVVIEFAIDAQSIDYLRDRIAAVRRSDTEFKKRHHAD